jgi:hypothetical protein
LQAAINEGARHSWKLVGVTQDPTTEGDVILGCDTSGFFSGYEATERYGFGISLR